MIKESEAIVFGLKRTGNGKAKGATKTKTRECHVIDLTRVPYISFGQGKQKGNPKRCLSCGQPIKDGEPWRTYNSEEDPKYGRYGVIVHSYCPGPKT